MSDGMTEARRMAAEDDEMRRRRSAQRYVSHEQPKESPYTTGLRHGMQEAKTLARIEIEQATKRVADLEATVAELRAAGDALAECVDVTVQACGYRPTIYEACGPECECCGSDQAALAKWREVRGG